MPKVTSVGPSHAGDATISRNHLLRSVPPEVWALVEELASAAGLTYRPTATSGSDAAAAPLSQELVP